MARAASQPPMKKLPNPVLIFGSAFLAGGIALALVGITAAL
jgi:hypothetical protein